MTYIGKQWMVWRMQGGKSGKISLWESDCVDVRNPAPRGLSPRRLRPHFPAVAASSQNSFRNSPIVDWLTTSKAGTSFQSRGFQSLVRGTKANRPRRDDPVGNLPCTCSAFFPELQRFAQASRASFHLRFNLESGLSLNEPGSSSDRSLHDARCNQGW